MELKQLEKQLPKQIKTVWRQVYSIAGILLLLVSAGLLAIFYYAEINLAFSLIGFLITLAYFLFCFLFLIPFRWKRWSYQIRHDEIEIQHGIIFRSRILVPMIRIQHVETAQGPLLRKQNLVSLSITTAAGAHVIEAVNASTSDELRHHILELVKVAKEDV